MRDRRERDRSGGLVNSVKKEGREEEKEGGITTWMELTEEREEREEREEGEGSEREGEGEEEHEGKTGWLIS